MSLPWHPELQQVRTRSRCESLQWRLRVKRRRKSDYAFCAPLWVSATGRLGGHCFRKASRSQAKSFVHGRVLGVELAGGASVTRLTCESPKSRSSRKISEVWLLNLEVLVPRSRFQPDPFAANR